MRVWPWALLLLGGGLMLAKSKTSAASTPAPSGLTLDFEPLRALDVFKRRESRLRLVGYLVQAWITQGIVSVDEMATLLAIAYRESGYRLDAISGPNAPDAAVGDAHSLFQITGDTAAGLHVDIRQLVPWGDPNSGQIAEAEYQRATIYNAHAAVRFLEQKPRWSRPATFREATLSKYAGDPYAVARQYFTSWAGGAGRTWESIADKPVDERPGSLGYIHVTILHKMQVLNPFRRALGLAPLAVLEGRQVADIAPACEVGSPGWQHRAVALNWDVAEHLLVGAAPRGERNLEAIA